MSLDARRYHDVLDAHRGGRRIINVLLGGQDGLVNALGVVLGVAAATHSTRLVVVAALAAAFAETIAMAGVAFTSSRAQAAQFASELARERRHIDTVPDIERDEIRALYARRGFSGPLLERVVETITRDKDVWIAVMMSEEHKLQDVDRRVSMSNAVQVGIAALLGSLIPIVPFFIVPALASPLAVIISAAALFAFGAYKAHVTVGSPIRSGFNLALIGTLSALAGWGIGTLLHVA